LPELGNNFIDVIALLLFQILAQNIASAAVALFSFTASTETDL
jgi:hypothetical protein